MKIITQFDANKSINFKQWGEEERAYGEGESKVFYKDRENNHFTILKNQSVLNSGILNPLKKFNDNPRTQVVQIGSTNIFKVTLLHPRKRSWTKENTTELYFCLEKIGNKAETSKRSCGIIFQLNRISDKEVKTVSSLSY